MATRLPEKYRLRTTQMIGTIELVTAEPKVATLVDHVFQDDITLIGAQIRYGFLVHDPHANADGFCEANCSLTRAGVASSPGAFMYTSWAKVWTAAIVIGNEDNLRTDRFVLPHPYGQEFDEGEGISYMGFFQWHGAGGNLSYYADILLMYVER